MEKIEVTTGVWLLNVPEADLRILCGCPPDVVKALMKRGLISRKPWDKGLWENGPNAILLSDVPMQGGKFANLAEFPILHMFYRQGMIVPDHPGNTGRKPLVMGLSAQLTAVCEYLFRGTYGLADREEILECGIKGEFADEIIRLKLSFAYNRIRKSEDILALCKLDAGSCEVAPGLTVDRLALNRYRFTFGDESVEIDLNLREGETYESPVQLEHHKVGREYFSVVHIGEGDGWDDRRPCMSSIVIFQGKIFLIDTGPNILDSLTALGISVNEIAGIFHTHAHDDHFAGLTSLVYTDHKIAYYATPLVRASVTKKLTSLMSIPEKRFLHSFEIHNLKHGEWNNIGGLEVMPVFSPHPVETDVFFFRAMWEGCHKIYAHLSDIASFEILDRMLMKDLSRTKASESLFNYFTLQLARTVDLKKVDIGGGMIHGDARDFANDRSGKIVLGHLARELTSAEKEIGSGASFGMEDVLIPVRYDYVREQARGYLAAYFPTADECGINMLLNSPISCLNIGDILQKKGAEPNAVYLIITGVAEMVSAGTGEVTMLSAGTLIGEAFAVGCDRLEGTYRARSYLNALVMPTALYTAFIKRYADYEDVRRTCSISFFLQMTPLFGAMVSSPVLHRIANNLVPLSIRAGAVYDNSHEPSLVLVRTGTLDVLIENVVVSRIGEGDFFGEECVFFSGCSMMSARALDDCDCYLIRPDVLKSIPIVTWKMLETYERRLTSYGAQLSSRKLALAPE